MAALTANPDAAWNRLIQDFRPDLKHEAGLPEKYWQAYLKDTRLIRVEDGAWFIETRDEHASLWLGDHFANLARRHLTGILGRQVQAVIFHGPMVMM